MTRTLLILVAGVCATLTGCSTGQSYQPKPPPGSKALIYIYRPYKFMTSQSVPVISCGHETIELDAGNFYDFEEDPETIACTISSEPNFELKFDVEPGQRYFIREEIDAAGLTTHARLVKVDPDLGADEIKECTREGIKS